MKLTRRQEEFIANLHELNKELDGPIHYSLVAERLGVSPFTAYDMLCLLEEKGLAKSEYQLASGKNGPGRAERVFYPSGEALAKKEHMLVKAGLASGMDMDIHLLIQDFIQPGEICEHELLEEMLARIPAEINQDELHYCMELATIVSLRMRNVNQGKLYEEFWSEYKADDMLSYRAKLCTLAGFASGSLAYAHASDPGWVDQLLSHVHHFVELVTELEQDDLRKLVTYMDALFTPETEILKEHK